jgi:hypothetical protein
MGEDLLLGIKSLKSKDEFVANFLLVSNYKNLFSQSELKANVKIWNKLDSVLSPILKENNGVSGMAIDKKYIHITIASNTDVHGGLYLKIDRFSGEVKYEKRFKLSRPEGVCINRDNRAMLVFEMADTNDGYYLEI